MLFGDSDAMRAINKTIHQLRNNDTTSVLIAGETGVGKEVVARAIHAGGPRAPTPFVPLNCGAIPYELAESVLFGHVRGAFTSAIADQIGYFERADGRNTISRRSRRHANRNPSKTPPRPRREDHHPNRRTREQKSRYPRDSRHQFRPQNQSRNGPISGRPLLSPRRNGN